MRSDLMVLVRGSNSKLLNIHFPFKITPQHCCSAPNTSKTDKHKPPFTSPVSPVFPRGVSLNELRALAVAVATCCIKGKVTYFNQVFNLIRLKYFKTMPLRCLCHFNLKWWNFYKVQIKKNTSRKIGALPFNNINTQ